jgi:hypothetical protein
LFPLQDTPFEGISVRVPHDSAKILAEEYGKKSLTNTRYHWYAIVVTMYSASDLTLSRHRFNKASKIWEAE